MARMVIMKTMEIMMVMVIMAAMGIGMVMRTVMVLMVVVVMTSMVVVMVMLAEMTRVMVILVTVVLRYVREDRRNALFRCCMESLILNNGGNVDNSATNIKLGFGSKLQSHKVT